MTTITISAASARVVSTSRRALSMAIELSKSMIISISAGRFASSAGRAACTARDTASGLASGAGVTDINTASRPLVKLRI